MTFGLKKKIRKGRIKRGKMKEKVRMRGKINKRERERAQIFKE
jgi:hypothetical protein